MRKEKGKEHSMNVLAELSVVWNSRTDHGFGKTSLGGNPLPYFEDAFKSVQNMVLEAYTARNCTYAEMLEAIRKADSEIVARYFELFDAVDCDVYGKWCAGALSAEEYDLFCRTVDDWKDITSKMIRTLERVPA
jgi:hypothetical protein